MLPVSALAYDYGGQTYNDTDYNTLLAFLEHDGGGGKNGEILNPGVYDPLDPQTWAGVMWYGTTTKRAIEINFDSTGVAGDLDLSGMDALDIVGIGNNSGITSLDVTGCTSLRHLNLNFCAITALDVSSCGALVTLLCTDNALTSLTLGTHNDLSSLQSWNNAITALDVSGCPALLYLHCQYNALELSLIHI